MSVKRQLDNKGNSPVGCSEQHTQKLLCLWFDFMHRNQKKNSFELFIGRCPIVASWMFSCANWPCFRMKHQFINYSKWRMQYKKQVIVYHRRISISLWRKGRKGKRNIKNKTNKQKKNNKENTTNKLNLDRGINCPNCRRGQAWPAVNAVW